MLVQESVSDDAEGRWQFLRPAEFWHQTGKESIAREPLSEVEVIVIGSDEKTDVRELATPPSCRVRLRECLRSERHPKRRLDDRFRRRLGS